MATALETQLLYITYFGRPADPAGLSYWTTGPQAGLPLDQVADFFASDVEFAQTTAGKTTEQIINSFYVNAFGRQADAAGLQFWTAKVNNGEISIQDVGLFIALGALAQPSGSPDRVALESKQAASQTWTGLVAADVTATLEYAGPLAATFGVDFLKPVVSTATIPSPAATQASINGLPPVGTVALLSSNASSVPEGGTVIFLIQTVPDLAGQTIAYELSGVQAADVVGGQLVGNVLISATGVGVIQVTIAEDEIFVESETLQIDFPNQIVFSKPPGSDSVVINDNPPPSGTVVLTTATDVVAATAVAEFTFIGTEQTLGQNDQLTGRGGTDSKLLIGTDGSFTVDNFTSFGIQTLELNSSGEDLFDVGVVDLSRAFGLNGLSGQVDGLTKININQSELGLLVLDDIQSAVGFTTEITDSFSTIVYNFDVNALAATTNLVSVVIEETPVDATSGEALGLDFTQGPLDANASIEFLSLTSLGSITNVVDQLSVGDALTNLFITGDASLDITTDLGLPSNDNRRISTIEASALDGDLSLRYTSILGDVINNFLPDVRVFGAIGDNFLELGTQSPAFPTDFSVVTQAGDDTVFTVGGEDQLFVGEGDNIVDTNAGNDTITSGSGDDTIDAGDDNDVVNAGDGDNSVIGGFGNDSVTTGVGNDFIVGDVLIPGGVEGAGNDTINSGAGEDFIFTGGGANLVDAGADNDFVVVGQVVNDVLLQDTFANTVLLGLGDDGVVIDTDSLTFADSINGGAGIDTIDLANGGTLLRSETLRVSRIEAFDLIGPSGDYSITLSDELVRTSDDIGSRIFSVFTSGDLAGNVTLDLSFLTPVDLEGNLISIRYSGQDDTDSETIIIRDELISPESVFAFGEAPLDADETFADKLLILDSADVTAVDLVNVTGLEVIELGSSVNGPQTFTFDLRNLSVAQFNSLVGDSNDVLIIRATPLLAGSVSTLTIDLTGADPLLAGRIIVEQSADLNVSVVGVPPGFVTINTALFYTPNADNLLGTAGNDTFTAFQLSDVQAGDFADGFGGVDTLEFEFAVSNPLAPLALQLSLTNISNIEIFDFNPAAVNQPVRFSGIGLGFAPGLQSIFTAGGDDFLVNIERDITVNTSGGNDTVSGFGFASLFADLGTGNDSFLGALGNDTVIAGVGNDIISTDGGNDSVLAGEGNDSVLGGSGSDTINAGDGTNTVLAGTGADSVVTGNGADSISTAVALEVQNDTVSSGAGADTVLVGLGDDSVSAGAGNDLIVLGVALPTDTWTRPASTPPQFATFTFPVTTDVNGWSAGDRINGGDGIDTVSFALADASVTTISSTQFQNVEVFNISGFQNATLNVSNTLAVSGTPLRFNLAWDVINAGTTDSFTFDATSFVQGQGVQVYASDFDNAGGLAGIDTFRFGAGNDLFHESTLFGGQLVIAGNGGSDTITLAEGNVLGAPSTTIVYNTGNDGGTGGTGTGGDLITGYVSAEDSIDITGGLLIDIGGLLSTAPATNAQLVLGGLSSTGNAGNNLSGRNILNLTGPARSLTDAQLLDANAVAENINGVGVIGNGLALGDLVGIITFVDAVTNQALIVQQGQTDTALYLYTESSFDFANPQAYTVQASELRQLGVFDNSLFTGTELV
jgi:Ca2+-binding RTX toxin-like protein